MKPPQTEKAQRLAGLAGQCSVNLKDSVRTPNGQSPRTIGLRGDEGRTEAANASRIVAQHGANIRWCEPWLKWLIWDGKRWAMDQTRRIDALAKETAAKQWEHVGTAQLALEAGEAKAIITFARASNSANGIRHALELARSEPGVPVRPEALDSDPWLLCVENGVLDLRTGKLRPHDQADYITKLAPVVYDPDADCPTWHAFLKTIFAGDRELIAFIRRAVGFSLTGCVNDHALFFCYGTGANGKSTFLNAIIDLLGGDYAIKAASDLLLSKKGAHPTEVADLFGKRFVACVEADSGRRMAESLVKELTGGDRVRARRMREDFWEFAPSHKLWLAANSKPTIRGSDFGIWRRIKLVPFTVTIPEQDQDKRLGERLKAELPGILNWAMLGLAQWRDMGLAEPDAVRAATAEYRAEQDTIGQFLDECCAVADHCEVTTQELYRAYKTWGGECTQRLFSDRLIERGFENVRFTFGTNKGRKGWRGVGLLASEGEAE